MHETIKTAPAVALGIVNHVWTIAELIESALAILPTEPEPGVAPGEPSVRRSIHGCDCIARGET